MRAEIQQQSACSVSGTGISHTQPRMHVILLYSCGFRRHRFTGYLPTYQHTYMSAYLHTSMPTYLHTCIPAYLHTYIPTHLHSYIPAFYLFTCLNTNVSFIPAYLHKYIRAYIARSKARRWRVPTAPTARPRWCWGGAACAASHGTSTRALGKRKAPTSEGHPTWSGYDQVQYPFLSV